MRYPRLISSIAHGDMLNLTSFELHVVERDVSMTFCIMSLSIFNTP